jgi:hypothetical protein
MNCPEHLVFKAFNSRLYVWMIWRDVPRHKIPWYIWLHPLCYEIVVHAFKHVTIVNRYGVKVK